MFEWIARRRHIRSVELKRLRACDEGIAAGDRRLRPYRAARLTSGRLYLLCLSDRTDDCQRECHCYCMRPHVLLPRVTRPALVLRRANHSRDLESRARPGACELDGMVGRVESRSPGAENKAVTDTTFIRFRGPQALKDKQEIENRAGQLPVLARRYSRILPQRSTFRAVSTNCLRTLIRF